MISKILADVFGVALLAAMIGWGAAIGRLLVGKGELGWGLKGVIGVAWTTAIGGVLNLFRLISPGVLGVYVGLGVAFCAFDFINRRNTWVAVKAGRAARLALLLAWMIILVQFFGSAWTSRFNPHDDLQAYFVFPAKMVQTGGMGADPFSERRMVTSLGGMPFLHSLVLAFLPPTALNLIDRGLGILLAAGVVSELMKKRGASPAVIAGLLLVLGLTWPPQVNITAMVLPVGMLIALYELADEERPDRMPIGRAALIGLLVAGICSLKMSLIPAVGFCLVAMYIVRMARREALARLALEFAITGAAAILMLLPWMIDMYRSSGTPLYPLLGKGYHGTSYGSLRPAYWHMASMAGAVVLAKALTRVPIAAMLISGAAAVGLLGWRSKRGRSVAAFMMGTLLAAAGISLALGGEATFRYWFSYVFAATLIAMIEGFSAPNGPRTTIALALAAGLLIGESWTGKRNEIMEIASALRNRNLVQEIASDAERRQYAAMQDAIPAGQVILERLSKPFLLNFRRNPILIVDYPAGASPPPGMPSFKGSEALARYLLDRSIRYVAYSYKDEAGFSEARYGYRLGPKETVWMQTQSAHTFDFQNNLRELGRTGRIYDDGEIFVIDLLQHRGATGP